jgi:rubrerythrin
MAEFVNPFSGMVPDRKLNDRELARVIRMALAAEEEAVHMYEAMADASDNALAAKVLHGVADEERVHAGEFQELLRKLLPDEQQLLQKGADEVQEMVRQHEGKATLSQVPKDRT